MQDSKDQEGIVSNGIRFDEHGTPITVTAETQGISPQEVVDKYHKINTKAFWI